MAPPAGPAQSDPPTWRAARFVGAVALTGLVSFQISEWRGPVLGVLAFLTYGLILGSSALSMSWVRRWSAEHSVADAAVFMPLLFFVLLLVPVLPWWVAALIAVAVGAVFVPIAVRRRTARAARQADR